MPDGLEERELPIPKYLSTEEKERSRELYVKIFTEDTQRFVDCYYHYKVKDNQILVLEEDEQIVSMLHLNPYQMIVNGYEVKCNYIVAVATQENYRHRGYMRILLEQALKDMAKQGMPFTFLMPASESIYAPFDFVWICPYTTLSPRVERMNAENQNRYLASRYQLFCKRDEKYMEYFLAQKEAMRGESQTEQMPPYMARITDVAQMLQMVYSMKQKALYLHIKDNIIEKNHGYFYWEVSSGHSQVRKLLEVPKQIDLELSIGELTSMVFESFQICLSELV